MSFINVVLDMARHVPLYRALLQLLRAMAVSGQLVGLLLPPIEKQGGNSTSGLSVCCLLTKMRSCVDTYDSRLRCVFNSIITFNKNVPYIRNI